MKFLTGICWLTGSERLHGDRYTLTNVLQKQHGPDSTWLAGSFLDNSPSQIMSSPHHQPDSSGLSFQGSWLEGSLPQGPGYLPFYREFWDLRFSFWIRRWTDLRVSISPVKHVEQPFLTQGHRWSMLDGERADQQQRSRRAGSGAAKIPCPHYDPMFSGRVFSIF